MWRSQQNQIKVVFRFSPPNFVSDYQYSNCWIQKYTNWEFVLHSKQVLPLNLAMQVKWRTGNRNLEYSCQIQINLQTSELFAGLNTKTGIIVNIFHNTGNITFYGGVELFWFWQYELALVLVRTRFNLKQRTV